jgi:hypothetical protein
MVEMEVENKENTRKGNGFHEAFVDPIPYSLAWKTQCMSTGIHHHDKIIAKLYRIENDM